MKSARQRKDRDYVSGSRQNNRLLFLIFVEFQICLPHNCFIHICLKTAMLMNKRGLKTIEKMVEIIVGTLLLKANGGTSDERRMPDLQCSFGVFGKS